MSGRVVHFEIPADNLTRAQDFYREAFGWTITPAPDMNYTMVATTPTDASGMPKEAGSINGGMMTRQGPITSPVITIEVDDIDATLPRIEQLGGAVAMPKRAIGDMGFAAYFTDPEGNLLGLWEEARKPA